jgi:hypothetical protein
MVKRSLGLGAVAALCLMGCQKHEIAPFSSSSQLGKEAAKQRKASSQGSYAEKAKQAYLDAQKHR